MRGDLIETYKIMGTVDKIDIPKLLPRVEMSNMRGHGHKVRGQRFHGDVRGSFFTQRMVGT